MCPLTLRCLAPNSTTEYWTTIIYQLLKLAHSEASHPSDPCEYCGPFSIDSDLEEVAQNSISFEKLVFHDVLRCMIAGDKTHFLMITGTFSPIESPCWAQGCSKIASAWLTCMLPKAARYIFCPFIDNFHPDSQSELGLITIISLFLSVLRSVCNIHFQFFYLIDSALEYFCCVEATVLSMSLQYSMLRWLSISPPLIRWQELEWKPNISCWRWHIPGPRIASIYVSTHEGSLLTFDFKLA
jgi:hypothetical protein